VIAKRCCFFFG